MTQEDLLSAYDLFLKDCPFKSWCVIQCFARDMISLSGHPCKNMQKLPKTQWDNKLHIIFHIFWSEPILFSAQISYLTGLATLWLTQGNGEWANKSIFTLFVEQIMKDVLSQRTYYLCVCAGRGQSVERLVYTRNWCFLSLVNGSPK